MENNEDLQRLSRRLKKLRKEKGYSNYEYFAFENGIARAQYGKYETGKKDIRLTTLLKIIRALDMTPEQFFKGFEKF